MYHMFWLPLDLENLLSVARQEFLENTYEKDMQSVNQLPFHLPYSNCNEIEATPL